jgi:predicted enzyme related to lactoylglutathione lyase
MKWAIELVPLPVTDVDKAKRFYAEQMGFAVDVDAAPAEGFRVVQLTPAGSACSIVFGTGIVSSPPGSVQGLHLCVYDIEAARAELVGRGVAVEPIRHMVDGVWHDGLGGEYNAFASISDPDGNTWMLQQVPQRD